MIEWILSALAILGAVLVSRYDSKWGWMIWTITNFAFVIYWAVLSSWAFFVLYSFFLATSGQGLYRTYKKSINTP